MTEAAQTTMFEQAEPFKDVQFMTAEEKGLVLKQWKTFVENGFQWKDFTDRVYKHLSLNCSFIAHHDRHGFYATYFEDPDDTMRFLKQFDRREGAVSVEIGMTYWIMGDYADLNNAMCEVVEKYREAHEKRLQREARERDINQAKVLLRRHGIDVSGL